MLPIREKVPTTPEPILPLNPIVGWNVGVI